MSNWEKLDICNLPSDILVGEYEWQFIDLVSNNAKWTTFDRTNPNGVITTLENCLNKDFEYRYRKKETPPPTHEEIMTKWWRRRGVWSKVVSFHCSNETYRYGFYDDKNAVWADKDWFIGKQSANIPPEA